MTTVKILPKAVKVLERLPRSTQTRILLAIDSMENDPLAKAKKLTNQPGYRCRVGDYRILFIYNRKTDLVVVARIAHRKDAYR